MDAKVKKAWVKALRSGKYAQGREALARRKPHGKTQFCCLGVLCDITGVRRDRRDDYSDILTFDNEESYLPPELGKRLGITKYKQMKLARMNDAGGDFNKLADYIEEKL